MTSKHKINWQYFKQCEYFISYTDEDKHNYLENWVTMNTFWTATTTTQNGNDSFHCCLERKTTEYVQLTVLQSVSELHVNETFCRNITNARINPHHPENSSHGSFHVSFFTMQNSIDMTCLQLSYIQTNHLFMLKIKLNKQLNSLLQLDYIINLFGSFLL